MDKLIAELEGLREKPQLTNSQVVGVMLSTVMRFRTVLNDRMVGIQALATAMALQPEVDALRLHDDFQRIMGSHFESERDIPSELRDIASAIRLAAADRS